MKNHTKNAMRRISNTVPIPMYMVYPQWEASQDMYRPGGKPNPLAGDVFVAKRDVGRLSTGASGSSGLSASRPSIPDVHDPVEAHEFQHSAYGGNRREDHYPAA